jgi:integrase/recombinase XerD
MANTHARLESRVKTEKGWRYVPAAPKWGGLFYVAYNDGKRRVRVQVGSDWNVGIKALKAKRAELQAEAQGLTLVKEPTDGRVRLADAVKTFLDKTLRRRDPRTHDIYKVSLTLFQKSCSKRFIQDVVAEDMLEFSDFLRSRGLSDRTVSNKFLNVMGFLRKNGVALTIPKEDRPHFTLTEPEIYTDQELDRLFAVMTPEEHLLYSFFLKSGLRDGEVRHAEFKNLTASGITVRANQTYKWRPKKNKERFVPLPASLMSRLQAARAPATNSLIFPGPSGGPSVNMLERLKVIANKAGVEGAYLHKFRHTYGTTVLRKRVADLKTLQMWMGHTDLASTMRYLSADTGPDVQARVDAM